jgi:intein/homing endonuclease
MADKTNRDGVGKKIKRARNVFSRLNKMFRDGPIVRSAISGKIDTGFTKASMGHLLNTNIYNSSTFFSQGHDRMARYCLAGDTVIATNDGLDGRITIKEMLEKHSNGVPQQVFSYNHKTNSVVLAKVLNVWLTKRDEVVEVEVDKGLKFKCTKDHRVMLRDGTYCEAQNLTAGMSLMPFYRKKFNRKNKNFGYRYIYSFDCWRPEHSIVAEYKTGMSLRKGNGFHVHHKNFKQCDNSFENLQVMEANEHLSFHAKINNKRFEDPKNREHMSTVLKKMWEPGGYFRDEERYSARREKASTHYESYRDRRIKYNKEVKPGKYNKGREDQKRFQNANTDKDFTIQNIYSAYCSGMSLNQLSMDLGKSRSKILKRLKWNGFNSFSDFVDNFLNHKVVTVKNVLGKEDVYDIEVEHFHNFAICDSVTSSGICFVHNSDIQEMESYAELNAALNIYADESVSYDERGNVLKVITDNDKIKDLLETLFYETLNIEFSAWGWVRSLCKWGDGFLLNMVDPEYGVVGVLPIPVQEIEREEGFDPSNPMSVRYRWATQNKILNSWQVTHFRLLGNDAYGPYGSSVLEGARRIWKQLNLLEDAVMVYRIVRCLHGDTRLWTENGYKHIRDIGIGDKVYSYDDNRKLRLSTVTDWINNGSQKIWKVKTRHRSIKTNNNHPILVRDTTTDLIDYVKTEDLIPHRHQLVIPQKDDSHNETPVCLKEEKYVWFGSLDQAGKNIFRSKKLNESKRSIEKALAEKLKLPENRIHQFLYVNDKVKGVPYDLAVEICDRFDIPIKHLVKHPKGMYNLDRLCLPKYVDEKFARFFGFMVGDGFMTKERHKIGFATGVYENVNNYYLNIFKEYCSSVVYENDKRIDNPILGRYTACNYYLCNLMADMGFTSSVYTKTIPDWVFRSSNKIKEAFIDGLIDADGHKRTQKNVESMEIELCNKGIVEGLKELCHQLGWNVSSEIRKRTRDEGRVINGFAVKETTSYSLYLTKEHVGLYENIVSSEETDEISDVFDIRVDNDYHNFVADGCVAHNSPERRVFKIDVGNIASDEIPAFMEKVQSQVKRDQVVDSSSGRVDLRYNALSVEDDYFIPVRGDISSEIETLAGGVYTGDVSDIEYFQKKLFAALQIPRAYLGFDESIGGKCLHPDTMIPFLDGVERTISEVADLFVNGNDPDLWTYSYDKGLDRVVPSRVVLAERTRRNAELVRVCLDNGKHIDCTPDHGFVLRNGETKNAEDLLVGESLRTVNRRMKKLAVNATEYEQVYQPDTEKWQWTHKMVDSSINGDIVRNGWGEDEFLVVSVERLDERIDTYNMEVDDVNHHGVHNFYTSAGIVVKNSTLSAEDVRFSRTIQRVQRVVISELTKLAIIHLYVHGFDGEDLIDFELRLSNPSNVAEQQKLELWRTRFEIANSIPEGYFDREFVQKNIFQLSNREIAIIKHKRIEDKKEDNELEAMQLPPEPEVGGEGGGFGGGFGGGEEELFGGEGGGEEELFGGEEEEPFEEEEISGAGGEETVGGGGLFAHKVRGDKELIMLEEDETGVDVIDDDEEDDGEDEDKEPRVRDQKYKFKHNRQRTSRHGPDSTQMPDLANIGDLGTTFSKKTRQSDMNPFRNTSIGEKAIRKVDFEINSLISELDRDVPKKPKRLVENTDIDKESNNDD